jgi:hypothetical protein
MKMTIRTRIIVGAALLSFLLQQPAALSLTVVERPGYTLKAFVYNDQKVRVTTITGGSYAIRAITPYARWGQAEGTSVIGQRAGALVAVNGDLKMHAGPKMPRRPIVINGQLWTTGWLRRQPGFVLTTNEDGTRARIGRPRITLTATIDGTAHAISSWNFSQPAKERLVGFNARGGTEAHPSERSCFALLAPVSSTQGGSPIVVTYQVRALRLGRRCDERPLQPPRSAPDRVVLAGRPLRGMSMGSQVTITFDYGFRHAWQMMGGMPMVVDDGTNIGQLCPVGRRCNRKIGEGNDNPFYQANARTGVGISEGCTDQDDASPCTYYLVTVDGNRKGWSCCGVRFPGLGAIMVQQGAWQAMNMDGGGSTETWVQQRNVLCQARRYTGMQATEGCIVGRPSYTERVVVQGVGLFPVSP